MPFSLIAEAGPTWPQLLLTFIASFGGLALSIAFCFVAVKIMFRDPKLSEKQLASLEARPVLGMLLPTHTADVFGRQFEVRRRLEEEARAYRERFVDEG